MQNFSPNMLKTFEQCPKKFELKYVEQICLPQNSKFFEKGKNLHALASYYLQGFDVEKMEKSLNQEEMKLWTLLKSNKYFQLTPIQTEYNLSCKIDKFWVGGRLDALVCEDKKTPHPNPLPQGARENPIRLYNKKALNQAKSLRKTQTEPEAIMWFLLRDRNFFDFKFKRQAPIGQYIADFVCFEKKLIIELDGSEHLKENQKRHDEKRSEFLNSEGYTILRFSNSQIYKDLDNVLEQIYQTLAPWGRGQGEGSDYYILDYKTGSVPQNPQEDFQTIIYLLAVDKLLKGNYNSLKFVYLGLKENENKIIEMTEELKTKYENKILETLRKIELNVFKKNQNNCKYCEYQKICNG